MSLFSDINTRDVGRTREKIWKITSQLACAASELNPGIVRPYTFVSQLYDSKAWGGQTAIHLSLICMTVRLGWTDCHTFVSSLYDSKAWVN